MLGSGVLRSEPLDSLVSGETFLDPSSSVFEGTLLVISGCVSSTASFALSSLGVSVGISSLSSSVLLLLDWDILEVVLERVPDFLTEPLTAEKMLW